MKDLETDFNVAVEDDHYFEARKFLGVDVEVCTAEEAIDELIVRLDRREKTLLAFANTNLLNCGRRDPEIEQMMESFIVLNDGVGMDLASWFKYGEKFPDNLNGTDFTPRLLDRCAGRRVFLYGSELATVQTAAQRFQERNTAQIVGCEHGFIKDPDQLFHRINQAGADIVLVGMGNPRQEKWIFENRDRVHAPLMIGVGALFEFVSGTKRRAPNWARKARLEWAARLMQEPQRLAKRYTVDIGAFFLALAYESMRGKKARNGDGDGA